MKHIPPIVLIVFLTSVVALAQSVGDNCPRISVEGPSSVPMVGDVLKYHATVTGLSIKPTYFWTISSGTISKGQGTEEIETVYDKEGLGITATVEIQGLPKNCQAYASETSSPPDRGYPVILDQYTSLTWKNQRTRLDVVKEAMEKNPNASVYFLIYAPKPENHLVLLRISQMKKYFGSKQDRLNFIVTESSNRQTKTYLIPVGVKPPIP